MASVLKASVSPPSAHPREKRDTPIVNPSLTDFVAMATRLRRNDASQSSNTTPEYADLYGEHDEASPDNAQFKTPDSLRSIVGVGAGNAQHQRKPRYTRRCSITKFSLQRTARVAVRQLQQEHSARRSIQSGQCLSGSSNRTGPRYRDIAPILDQAMADIDANCF